ncbi:MAG: hypothetical protein K0R17_3600 [Rariglobus sp.]|jgi:hypothetical protein|nr:hypothetical protein [Rariglobus sp.]
MIFYTGWVTLVVIIGAVLSVALLNSLRFLGPEIAPGTIALLRWSLLFLFGAVIFVIGWLTNQKKVLRMGSSGKTVKGVPNTIFFVPLQYWAVFYWVLIGVAISRWTSVEALH